ncbi:hypothetical protein B9Z19DRAFT_1131086 [Tuber borchii]|uniref:GPI anchored serine-threonine rich protein n=1 Tax=Tuber borchii TaxID=42251 RepID=A0A2T6ZJC9_TUBBO|nr:hypothetical protein B9Z19DRAFT_1131086 [Tuber borchii]
MKNSAQLYLYLLAVLMVGQSLAANMTPHLFVRRAHVISGPEASGLEKRKIACPITDFMCPGGGYCCPFGTTCEPGAMCGGASCGVGSTPCGDSCCNAGFACQGPNKPCLKTIGGGSIPTIPGNTIVSSSTLTIPGNTIVSSSTSTIPGNTLISSSTPTIPGNTLVSSSTSTIPGNTLVSSSTTTIPTTKAVTSGTTILNTYTIPIKPTSTIANSVPTPPSMTPGGYSSNSTAPPNANSSSIAIIPIGGGNSLKPGAWLGALGAVFFFAFFHM